MRRRLDDKQVGGDLGEPFQRCRGEHRYRPLDNRTRRLVDPFLGVSDWLGMVNLPLYGVP